MNTRDADDQFSATNMSRQQMALTAQLFQAVSSMHHIDELFQWLAHALIRHFNIQLLQFWTNHISSTGQLAAQLRTIARQDASLPDQIAVNEQMQRIAQQLISERMAYNLQPVETIFSHYQAILLKRHGLSYWCACFTSGNVHLPPRADILSQRESSAFFAMTTLLFLRQSPQFNIVPAINAVLDEAIALATKRGLLLTTADPYAAFSPQAYPSLPQSYTPPSQVYTPQPQSYTPPSQPYTPLPQSYNPPSQPYAPPPQLYTPAPQPYTPPAQVHTGPPQFPPQEPPTPNQEAPLTLAQLILKRKQDNNDLLASNPFARPAVISDKKARRLHGAINGQANVAELSSTTGLNMQEIGAALRLLWDQQRIEAYESGGKPVNLSTFLNGF
jgi:hypothetical protein